MNRRYAIADNIIEIDGENDVWGRVEANFEPFKMGEAAPDELPAVKVLLRSGLPEIQSGWPMIYQDVVGDSRMPKVYAYRNMSGSYMYKVIQPDDIRERVMLEMNPDYGSATVYIEERKNEQLQWQTIASLTAALQMAYALSTLNSGTLFFHASAILHGGKAYLFLGKSGTGKSTHSRMWHSAFPETILLNDDHPIVKTYDAASPKAYGSPWSGKTPCYKNLSAPIGGIVRIRRGETNRIRRLTTIEAYASVFPSTFGVPFDRSCADMRHNAIERLIADVPCYELWCRPDPESAKVCRNALEVGNFAGD